MDQLQLDVLLWPFLSEQNPRIGLKQEDGGQKAKGSTCRIYDHINHSTEAAWYLSLVPLLVGHSPEYEKRRLCAEVGHSAKAVDRKKTNRSKQWLAANLADYCLISTKAHFFDNGH